MDTAAIRARAGTSYNTWSDYEVEELCDEIDALRAELAEMTAGYTTQMETISRLLKDAASGETPFQLRGSEDMERAAGRDQ